MTGGTEPGLPPNRVSIRDGEPSDTKDVVAVWRAANTTRRNGQPPTPKHEERVRSFVEKPDAFLIVADAGGEVVGVALGMQGRADDGAGLPIPGLCHVSMIFVAPERWGEGIGGQLVDAVLTGARSRGYSRIQLWTQSGNPRAQSLYEGRGFRLSGREKHDEDLGEHIVHYERLL